MRDCCQRPMIKIPSAAPPFRDEVTFNPWCNPQKLSPPPPEVIRPERRRGRHSVHTYFITLRGRVLVVRTVQVSSARLLSSPHLSFSCPFSAFFSPEFFFSFSFVVLSTPSCFFFSSSVIVSQHTLLHLLSSFCLLICSFFFSFPTSCLFSGFLL